MKSKWMSHYEAMGFDSFNDGQPITNCPYQLGSQSCLEWVRGWHMADDEVNKKRRRVIKN